MIYCHHKPRRITVENTTRAAFMKAYEETSKADGVCESLVKWLLLINAKDVKDKSIFKEISEEKED